MMAPSWGGGWGRLTISFAFIISRGGLECQPIMTAIFWAGGFFHNFICKIRKGRSGMKKLSRKTPKFSMAREFVRYSENTGF